MITELEWMPKGDWRGYEAYILGSLAAQFPGVRLEANVFMPGKKSHAMRQIDVLAHADQTIAIECKYLGRKVDVKCVEAVIGMLDDVGIGRGAIVTAVGFTAAARRRAANDQCDLALELIEPKRLSEYQHRGNPVIWRAPLGISLGHIDGWACDIELTNAPDGAAMMMYPLGHNRSSAFRAAPVIYANFLSKPRGDESLQELAAPHQETLATAHPNYDFKIERAVLADRGGITRPCLVRTASGPPPIFGTEHALYVDYGDVGLVLVLCAPLGAAPTLREALIGLYRDSFTLEVFHRR